MFPNVSPLEHQGMIDLRCSPGLKTADSSMKATSLVQTTKPSNDVGREWNIGEGGTMAASLGRSDGAQEKGYFRRARKIKSKKATEHNPLLTALASRTSLAWQRTNAKKQTPPVGLEPTTTGLKGQRSTN